MEIPVRQPRQPHEGEQDYAERRSREARAFVALCAPECIRMVSEIDLTLQDDRTGLTAREIAREHRAVARVWERHAATDR